MNIYIVNHYKHIPDTKEGIYLIEDNWDDYSYKTLFTLIIVNHENLKIKIGSVKIGFIGQEPSWTKESFQKTITTSLPEGFFSLGQDSEYYINLKEKLNTEDTHLVLESLIDIVHNEDMLEKVKNESVFKTSLLRHINITSLKEQFKRILSDEEPLTEYKFNFIKEKSEEYSGIELNFRVTPHSRPPSNIHIIIGRNGVGKTTILNNMITGLVNKSPPVWFEDRTLFPNNKKELESDYFSGLVSVSFSAFDPFTPPQDQNKKNKTLRYNYIGLKERDDKSSHTLKNLRVLGDEFTASIIHCLSFTAKTDRWIKSIKKLESDYNFKDMNLTNLVNYFEDHGKSTAFKDMAKKQFSKMSSGHAIVLLTMTRLVETVEEKTLVLIDEPESHLHPPLLSAFTRALSDLLQNRNGVAIIATHSPVVLQEVPSSCVSILSRARLESSTIKPSVETFAENVGILTREVFGLELSKSGYHDLLKHSVEEGKDYNETLNTYSGKLGIEGKALLQAMIFSRDSKK